MPVPDRPLRARLPWLVLAALVLAVVAGCTLKSGGYNTTSPPKVRFFNASPEIGTIDVTLGSVQAASLLTYEGFQVYRPASTGAQTITVTLSGSTTQVAQTTQDMQNGDRFSYILYGRTGAPRTLLVSDAVDLPGGGNIKLRLVNTSLEQGAIDLYYGPAGSTLDNATPVITNIPPGGASDFVEQNAGSQELRITRAGTKQVLYDSGQATLSERNAYTIVAYDRGSVDQVNVGLFTNDTLGSGGTLNSIFSEARLLNAAPGVPSINATVDTNTFANVAYDTVSTYQLTQGGTRGATIVNSATPSTTLVTGSVLLPPGGAATMVLLGAPGAQQAFALQDFNLSPRTPGAARVRVVNASTGVGDVTTLINGALTVGALGQGLPSLYFELPPATYTFDFADATGTTRLLDIPGVALAADRTYTLFLVGPPGQLTYLLSLDR